MTDPAMDPTDARTVASSMLRAVRPACELLSPIPYSFIHLGCSLPMALVEALAEAAGVRAEATLYLNADGTPRQVIEHVEFRLHGVKVEAQGSRPATESDKTRCAICREAA